MFVFFSHIQLPSFPHAKRPHGLNAEAIANEKWGIATDRLKKMKKSALLVSGSALGFWFLRTWLLVPQVLVHWHWIVEFLPTFDNPIYSKEKQTFYYPG